jgi:hypothetical protein
LAIEFLMLLLEMALAMRILILLSVAMMEETVVKIINWLVIVSAMMSLIIQSVTTMEVTAVLM